MLNLTIEALSSMLGRIEKIGNPSLSSPMSPIRESWAMVKTHWRRLPKSKKRRVRKKWEKLQAGRYKITTASNEILYVNGEIICHPFMAAHLREMRMDVVQGALGILGRWGR